MNGWVLTALLILVVVFACWAGPIARKECEAKGGTMVYAGKMAWCEVER